MTGNLSANGGVGSVGQLLTSNSTGGVYWQTPASGSVPGGANTDVQFNDSALFGGGSGFTFDKAVNNAFIANTLTVGIAIANSTQVGVGSNVILRVSNLLVGNSTVNVIVGNTSVAIGNTVANVLANSTAILLSNSIANTLITPGNILINGNMNMPDYLATYTFCGGI